MPALLSRPAPAASGPVPTSSEIRAVSVAEASLTVDKFVLEDKTYPDLALLLNVSHHDRVTESGLQDTDYPRLTDDPSMTSSQHPQHPPLSELALVKQLPLPNELIEQSRHMQCRCSMGLFTEISRAWLTIDSNIYIWNYETGEDLAYFDGLSETILSVGLVPPKQGIFQPHISHLLCLCTPLEFVILGVTFVSPKEANDGGLPEASEMHLLPDPLYSVPSDNVHIKDVIGTASGRIFLAGSDSFLYEILYQAEDSWFHRRCRKVNHTQSSFLSFITPGIFVKEESSLVQLCVDNGRHLLYTRSECGKIKAYYLGSTGTDISYLGDFSSAELAQSSARPLKTVDKSNFSSIVHIAPVGPEESDKIHLVAITKTGVRLYFTTRRLQGPYSKSPCLFVLVHVRLPPGFSPNTSVRPSEVHKAYYSRGCSLLAASVSEGSDQLWVMSGDAFPFQHKIMESQLTVPVAGRTWAVSEVPTTPVMWSQDPSPTASTDAGVPPSCENWRLRPPLVVTQHMEEARQMVLLSAQGTYLLSKLRPLDQLRALLLRNEGCEGEEVQAFFKAHFKTSQACATCMILACSRLAVDAQVCELAARALFLFGGEATHGGRGGSPLYRQPALGPSIGVFSPIPGDTRNGAALSVNVSGFPAAASSTAHPHHMSTPYHPSSSHGLSATSTPTQGAAPPGGLLGSTAAPPSGIVFSAKHDGIYLYIGRLLAPLWDSKLACRVIFTTPGTSVQTSGFASRVASGELAWFMEQVSNLTGFLNKHFGGVNVGLSAAAATESLGTSFMWGDLRHTAAYHTDDQSLRKYEAEAQTREKQSLESAAILLEKALQVIGLWKLLCDHDFNGIAGLLTDDLKNQLVQSATLKKLLCDSEGKELCSALIEALLRQYLGDNASTNSVSSKLRASCPSLFSAEDATVTKADELVQQCLNKKPSPMERRNLLTAAEDLYMSVAGSISIAVVCERLTQARYYEGALRLCLNAAAVRDPQSIALNYYHSGQPEDDSQGLLMFNTRSGCYAGVTKMLDGLLEASASTPSHAAGSPGINPPQSSTNGADSSIGPLTRADAEQKMESLLTVCMQSSDELLHTALFQWLLDRKLVDRLLSSGSPHLEKWLQRVAAVSTATSSMTPDPFDLLWKYYEIVKDGMAAAKILGKLAEKQCEKLSLQQRIEYLSRAIINAKSRTFRHSTIDGAFLHELEEKMEVARVQLLVLNTLQSKGPRSPATSEALHRLDSELLDITALYGEFANPFGLAECKLAIVHCAGHYDSGLVNQLWMEAIDQEFSTTTVSEEVVKSTIVRLAQKYGSTNRYFPVDFLVKELEQRACRHHLSEHWAVETLRSAGVSFSRLLNSYDRLYSTKDSCWRDEGRPRHLLFSIYYIFQSFTSAPTAVPSSDRARFVNTCKDALAGYLVELQGDLSADVAVQGLTKAFRDVKARLDRL